PLRGVLPNSAGGAIECSNCLPRALRGAMLYRASGAGWATGPSTLRTHTNLKTAGIVGEHAIVDAQVQPPRDIRDERATHADRKILRAVWLFYQWYCWVSLVVQQLRLEDHPDERAYWGLTDWNLWLSPKRRVCRSYCGIATRRSHTVGAK